MTCPKCGKEVKAVLSIWDSTKYSCDKCGEYWYYARTDNYMFPDGKVYKEKR